MIKSLSYLFSLIYYLFFGSLLVIFHPIQVVCFNLFGISAQSKAINYLNFFLIRCLGLLGTRIRFNNPNSFPKDRSLVFVSNHQSTYDIPPLIWFLRPHFPKFIAKKELGKGLPSISYHLRKGGNVLIDRKDSVGSLKAIKEFCENVRANGWSIVIFPEGTRTRNGQPKPFHRGGLKIILEEIPNALLVPISINNSWKLVKWKYFPMPLGIKININVNTPVDPKGLSIDEAIDRVETSVKNGINS